MWFRVKRHLPLWSLGLPQLVLLVICSLLIASNIFLLWQNSMLRAAARPTAETIKAGDELGNFQAIDKDGASTEIILRGASPKRVLFYFRSNCPYCQLQVDQWKALAEKLDTHKYRVIAITPEKGLPDINEFIEKNGIVDWEVLRIPPEAALRAKLAVTPITFVVDENGVVEKSWAGLWKPQDLKQVEDFFGVHLSS